ncbi:hypothetical protein KU6B_21680 [Mameliella alba]|nr:hypothetical protein KU6B_21680 [Mameliella alba]
MLSRCAVDYAEQNPGMGGRVSPEKVLEESGAQRGLNSDRQTSSFSSTCKPGMSLRTFEQFDRRFGFAKESLAGLSELDAAMAPVQKYRAELILDGADGAA